LVFIKTMLETLRVNTADFKVNPRPFVAQAKTGKRVIVTKDGHDDFQVIPCQPSGVPTRSAKPLDASLYEGIDVDSPGFHPWGGDEAAD